MQLICNNVKCQSDILKLALITICSHIFCQKCFPIVKKNMVCIACRSFLKESEIFLKELDFLPCLIGYPPDEIFEASQRGISFWIYQSEQNQLISNLHIEKASEQVYKYKNEVKTLRSAGDLEVQSLRQKLDRLECALERERQNGYDLSQLLSEKTKQYQKLLSINEKIRYRDGMKNISVYKKNQSLNESQ
ncbi:E3 ubiquitin-protein ligase CCNB1IP1 [Astathelohania contejeani]|uniref:E3 ubiquitin-protein ligase CCNB1IP1 n=1 Tax=Astathelohania contejeani TaxID=164912 RepID=A0ABQ7HXS2_9MICR|nr:E3 ubiquitin-protein ligase CCNB1IP1 [Thelohania contejeani]